MKSSKAYYLLIFYALAMCKPILPLVQDEIAHIFWKAHHISTVHHHHGDHHAEEELTTATHEEQSNKNPASKTSEPVSIHLIVQSCYNLPQLPLANQKFGISICMVSTLFLDKHYPPPKSS